MKRIEANRYPHSATLFKFCKQALEIRYDGNVKVIDQDVGAMLGYDPADCSHWKKGKKNIRALGTLRNLANNLNIDERLLIDIASGHMGFEEAIFEYRGYGDFDLTGAKLDELKKEYFKNPERWQKKGLVRSFEELFDVNRPAVIAIAQKIIEQGRFTEAPIYLPEVVELFPKLTLVSDEELSEAVTVNAIDDEGGPRVEIRFRGPEMRPYVRFLVAKQIYKFLVTTRNEIVLNFVDLPDEVLDIQANIFAEHLLVPTKLLRQEVERIDSSLDIVLQLAETFWVSKALMNQRLRDYMTDLA